MAPPRLDLKFEALAPHHDRDNFTCGVDSLDRYLRTQANQDVRRKANGVFVLVRPDKPQVVLGYYTLCATALAQGVIPAKEMASYGCLTHFAWYYRCARSRN